MHFRGSVNFIKKAIFASTSIFSLSLYAGDMGVIPNSGPWNAHPWLITASIGYTNYEHMQHNDGETALGRLAIGGEFTQFYGVMIGGEVGVQNGGNMRLDLTKTQLELLGSSPVKLTIKPTIDLLVTVKSTIFPTSSAFIIGKGGVAFRQMQNDRNNINDLSQAAGEIQVGLGHPISEITNLMLSYQGIYGGSQNFTINKATKTAQIGHIPSQQGVLLGVSVVL